jgi:UDP-GlcNAc:undecaprenyl-phosphate GlcNAc-1-phosphate transferase
VLTMTLSALTASCGLVFALFVSVNARRIGKYLGLLDYPDTDGGRKRHNGVTPLVGGLAVAGAAVGTTLAVYAMTPSPGLHLLWLAGTVSAMFVIGAMDDRFDLSPALRLGAAYTLLALLVSYAPDFSLAFLRFSGQQRLWLLDEWGGAFTLICLLGLLNAVNLADGKNGIVIGMGLIWTVVLAVHSPATMLPVLAATGAALLVVGGFNLAGKLFLGDSGSYALSALFGLLAIYAYNHDFEMMRADDVALMFVIPVLDTVRLMTMRIKQRRSPFEGDSNHLHHHLHTCIGWPRGLLVYLAMVGLPNAAALIWPGSGLVWLVVSMLIYVGVIAATSVRRSQIEQRPAE